jgi:hypothetical protein
MAHVSGPESAEWPRNPLDAARKAFAWLTAGPHPVVVDGHLFDYLPDREMPVDELRDLLLQRTCPRQVWDQVWSHVITRARSEGSTWTIVAVGLALPMLTLISLRLTSRFADDPSDVRSEILRGFLEGIHTVDLSAGRIAIRLRWHAYRAGHQYVTAALASPAPREAGSWSAEPACVPGHPDVVLARAVEAGVLTRGEAELIGTTRLEGVLLTDWPREPGCSYNKLRKFRRRAELRLAAWLTETPKSVADQPAQPGLQNHNTH